MVTSSTILKRIFHKKKSIWLETFNILYYIVHRLLVLKSTLPTLIFDTNLIFKKKTARSPMFV